MGCNNQGKRTFRIERTNQSRSHCSSDKNKACNFKVGFRSVHGGNKACSDDRDGRVHCNRGHVKGWEQFTPYRIGAARGTNGRWAFKGGHRRKWCADERHRVRCNRGHIRQWETFIVSCVSGCNDRVKKFEDAVKRRVKLNDKAKELEAKTKHANELTLSQPQMRKPPTCMHEHAR